MNRTEQALQIAIKAIDDYMNGNFDYPRKYRPGQCKHKAWYFENCEGCVDEHFLQAQTDIFNTLHNY